MSQSSFQNVLMLVNTYVQGDARVMAEATSLVHLGYKVHVIGSARHTQGGTPVIGETNGVQITLTPMDSAASLPALGRAMWRWLRRNLGTTTQDQPFRQSNLISLIFFNLWCLRLGLGRKIDVVHAHDLAPLPAAWVIARWRRARLIYDCHESAPDFYTGRKAKLATWLEKQLIPKVDVVITVGERLAQALRDRGARRVVVVGNWKRLNNKHPDEHELEMARSRLNLHGQRLIIAYLGSLQPERDIEPLLNAVVACPQVSLLISGEGILKQKVISASRHATNIHWLGWLQPEDVFFYTVLSDVIYYSINPDVSPQAFYSTPNKLFEAFAAGKAMIARRGIGELGEILEQTGAATLLDEMTVESLKNAFGQLENPQILVRLQHNALRACEFYNWETAEMRLLEIYSDLTSLISQPRLQTVDKS